MQSETDSVQRTCLKISADSKAHFTSITNKKFETTFRDSRHYILSQSLELIAIIIRVQGLRCIFLSGSDLVTHMLHYLTSMTQRHQRLSINSVGPFKKLITGSQGNVLDLKLINSWLVMHLKNMQICGVAGNGKFETRKTSRNIEFPWLNSQRSFN